MQNQLIKHLLLLVSMLWLANGFSQDIKVKNNFFYLDGEKFFVKGIGYEVGAIPGQLPWERPFDPELLHFDMQRIVAGGFNTIRTWAPFTAQELAVISQYELKIIMGIWIDPEADFSNPAFVSEAEQIVLDVMEYSKNFDNIIAYLIMNEPMPEKIAGAGYSQTVALWEKLIAIIHEHHPGRPVSISNSCNGTYIDPGIFDFSAFNVYIYNPVTVNFLHLYQEYVRYLLQLTGDQNPLIISEYGLSVSPSGPGNWGYGGNSAEEQKEGIIHMYSALINGGAAGSCIFNYSDGWWKGGNEFAHDDNAEEWFGLVNYSDLSDKHGLERPAWDGIKNYQSAIVTEPKESGIYGLDVPIEVFGSATVKRVEVKHENVVVFDAEMEDSYLLDTLRFDFTSTQDAVLTLVFFDEMNNIIKQEERTVLVTVEGVVLPVIEINILNDDYWATGMLELEYIVGKSIDFSSSPTLDHVFYPHVGFNYGESFTVPLPSADPYILQTTHSFAANVNVMTVGAAYNVMYNGFTRRIVGQRTLSQINEPPSDIKEQIHTVGNVFIAPNPAYDYVKVSKSNSASSEKFDYSLQTIDGRLIRHETASFDQLIDISMLASGVYIIRIVSPITSQSYAYKFVKF
jgi:hypothetical protein